ncbi:hypothetical protein PAXRUDRAFT_7994 [Paxillus rubicundulus Ve08.2h10]|uniref:Uncharacterized protein n=1 Tax=Paxillus rubicundulus Ve08.2h10 TaxID=930991 RepID=A0A0D0E6L1_9AGAM|nr:hypothetical protein PAXRUDRAFT_7994 [Paxillus rubicundulus Ve08.2h10]
MDDLTHRFKQLHMDPVQAPAPAPAPAPVYPQPPSLERPAPAQIVARTVNEDTTQRAQCHGRQQPERTAETLDILEEAPEFPGAFTASTESLQDLIFGGAANSKSNPSLPGTI